MHLATVAVLAVICCLHVSHIMGEDTLLSEENRSAIYDYAPVQAKGNEESVAEATLNRQKRTLLLKKKLIGAGLLGFGLGIAKGYKAGYHSAPQVRHVYLSPPPASVKYVEYVEKPVFVERIIERPASAFKPLHVEYKDGPSPYGAW